MLTRTCSWFVTVGLSGLLAAPAIGTPRQQPAAAEDAFPVSTALAVGVSPDALGKLSLLVQTLVDDHEIVGAELLVIKNGHSILHEAFGWRNREAKVAMKIGSVFCVRSMTKPIVGAAILMLIEDGQLALDDRVAQYLPAFDVHGSRDITVEHLLSHMSGLPMSLSFGKDLHELGDIQAVAALGGGRKLGFDPGSAMSYSDAGTDTLTALIEAVTGALAADFVRTRVLEPLGMKDSACILTEGHPLLTRACCKYAGSRGQWIRFWSPDDPSLFPFFLGSQSLYSTVQDYARFMEFWKSEGLAGKERLLGSSLVRKALTPGPHPFNHATGLPGLRCEYGFQMQLWSRPGAKGEFGEVGERDVVAFGHGGSDGTNAWVFPEQEGMVLYFTQSRNNHTGPRLEAAIGELFLGVRSPPNQTAPPLEEYLGYYSAGKGDLYRAIVRDGEDLALEMLGSAVIPLMYIGNDRWAPRPNPNIQLAFERSSAGEVTGFRLGNQRLNRFQPSDELPSVDELAARVAKVHRLDLLESLGPLRMNGKQTWLDATRELSSLLAWPDRYRVDTVIGEQFERLAFDGERIWYASPSKTASTLDGSRAEQLRLDKFFSRFGDWRRAYTSLQVIQRLDRGGAEMFLVRTGDTSAPTSTLYVHAKRGMVMGEDSMANIDGQGRYGQRIRFSDFRDVSGMLLPFRSEIHFADSVLGRVVTTVKDIELGVELHEGTFELRK